jgi:WD40 repeat protein
MPDPNANEPSRTWDPGTTAFEPTPPVPAEPPLPTIPGYRIEAVLGRGGMGVVYKARHLALKRTVALKMVRAGVSAGPRELARFRIEVEAAARLQHPNIVQIHEVGEADGHPYCAFEFVEGGSLASKIRGKPLAIHEAARLVEVLARAMQLAHSRNVVHRDLKPANILLTPDGQPKISDFGLARHLDSDSGETQVGAVMGTPNYMAPELASGRAHDAGPAADIWALGAILYECLTGRPPFSSETVIETLDRVRTQEAVPPSRCRRGVPLDLETICLKCLRKEPEKRYASALELADDLQRYQRGETILARPVGPFERAVRWVRRNPVLTGAALAVVLALAAGATVSYLKYLEADAARQAEAQRVIERDRALGEARLATDTANESAEELRYRLGVSNMLLASNAFDNRDVRLAYERMDSVPEKQRGWEWNYLARQTRGGLFTLYGHTHYVLSVAYSPDGAWIVTGSHDRTAKVWNARTGAFLRELRVPADPVMSVCFSPDSTRIVTGTYDGPTKVWDARTGKPLLDLRGHTQPVLSVAYSPDGTRIATGSEDRTARIWDARTGTPLVILKGFQETVRSVAYNPDGTRIATSSEDGTATVWDAGTGQQVLALLRRTPGITSVAYSPDGTRFMTGNRDNISRVWDARTGDPLFELTGHTRDVTSGMFSPDGLRIVTTSWDGTARVWDARTGAFLLDLKGHGQPVMCASFSPDGDHIVTAGYDYTAKVWDARTGMPQVQLLGHTNSVVSVDFSSDGARILTAGDATVRVWDARTRSSILEFLAHKDWVTSAAYSPDGTRILTGGHDNKAKVWNARTGELLLELKGHTRPLASAMFSLDGTRIVTGSWDQTAKIWDARTGDALGELKGHTGIVASVMFSPDGTGILTGSSDFTARVWDAQTGRVRHELKGHTQPVVSAAWSADGARIVTASNDRTAKIWDARTGKFLLDCKGHTDGLEAVCFSPDGTRIVTGSMDRTAKVWDVHTGIPLFELKGHTRAVTAVCFSPDGMRIVTGSDDRTARIWDARPGKAPVVLKGHTDVVHYLAFSPDGTRMATTSADSTARVWDARTGMSLVQLKGSMTTSDRIYFSLDGTRIVTHGAETRVWDARTGQELSGGPVPPTFDPVRTSPDGKFFAHAVDNRVEVIPLELDGEEVFERKLLTEPLPWRYRDELGAAVRASDRFVIGFFLERLLSLPTQRITMYFEIRINHLGDPIKTARTSFHHPELARTRYDPRFVLLMAGVGDRLATRLVAQDLIRDGKPAQAIPLLFRCLLARPASSPPVEELLLAQAYLECRQVAEARRCYRAAAEWLDRPGQPARVVNLVAHGTLNSWAGLGIAVAPVEDERRNPFDWETWHECDVFRAEVERRLAGKP